MERLRAVQRQLHRIEEWKLSEIERRLVKIEETRDELLAALDRDEALQSLFHVACARRLAALAREGEEAGRNREAQKTTILEQASRLKAADRIAANLMEVERRAAQRTLLLELIEAHLDRRAQASHKFRGA
jgi:Lhr-like helicase